MVFDRRTRPSVLRSAVTLVTCGMMAAGPAVTADRPARASTPANEPPVVLVQATQRLAPLSPYLTGTNNDQWFNNSHGLWDPVADAPNPDVVEKTRRTGLGMVRFPGGTSANLYDWKKGIGPTAERGCQTDGRANGGAGVLDSVYGPDEYMEFIEATGTEPEIMTPMSNSTPADAADWVEYMNAPVGTNPRGGVAWAQRRADSGHPEPYGVKFWEIGNEPDRVNSQNYWRSTDPTVAARQYTFGGSQAQVDQRLARGCDRRPAASVSDGSPGQQLELLYPPAVPGSQTIEVGGAAWTAVADLSAAGPEDKVYTFDPVTGAVRFGDGVHGAIPPDDAVLRADYTAGPKPGFVHFYDAMKQADPSIDVCATWAPVTTASGLGGASFAQLMAQAGRADDYDCVLVHPYTNFLRDFGDADWETAREGHDEHMLGEARATQLVRDLKVDLAEHSTGQAYVGISEFGALWFGGQGNVSAYPSWTTAMSHATYMASQWTRYAELGLPWVLGNTLISETPAGLRAVLGGPPIYAYTVDAMVREQLASMLRAGGRSVRTTLYDNPQITPVEPEPEFGTSYDALTATAAVGADGNLRIVVVNRHPDQAVTAKVVPAGFRHAGQAAVSTIAGDEFTSYNGVDNPDDVQLERSSVTVGADDFEYEFAAHSVTVLELPRQR
jgi:alpha-N-arabinofuranosidase